MANECLSVKQSQFFRLSDAFTLPQAQQIDIGDRADYLILGVGQGNQGTTAAPYQVEWRLYKGLLLPNPLNTWVSSYSVPAVPYMIGTLGAGQAIIPWGDDVRYVLELVGTGTFGTGSLIEVSITPFET